MMRKICPHFSERGDPETWSGVRPGTPGGHPGETKSTKSQKKGSALAKRQNVFSGEALFLPTREACLKSWYVMPVV